MKEFGLMLCLLGSSLPNFLKLNTLTSRSLISLQKNVIHYFVCVVVTKLNVYTLGSCITDLQQINFRCLCNKSVDSLKKNK